MGAVMPVASEMMHAERSGSEGSASASSGSRMRLFCGIRPLRSRLSKKALAELGGG